MSILANENFKIARMMRDFIIEANNTIILNINRKDYYYRDEFRSLNSQILQNIYYANELDNKEERLKILYSINANLAQIDFLLELFLKNKYISEKQLNKSVFLLTNVTKMTRTWIKKDGDDYKKSNN